MQKCAAETDRFCSESVHRQLATLLLPCNCRERGGVGALPSGQVVHVGSRRRAYKFALASIIGSAGRHARRIRIGPPLDSASTSTAPRVTFTRPSATSCAATRLIAGICARQTRSSVDSTRATSDGQIDADDARAVSNFRIVSAMAWSSCTLASGSRRSVCRMDVMWRGMPDGEHIAVIDEPRAFM